MINNARLTTVLAYAALVGWLSLQPGGNTVVGEYDKLAHFCTYALFAFLAFRLDLEKAAFLLCALGIVLYSGLLEFAQSFIPGRMMSGLDLVANTAGVLLGALICLLVFGKSKSVSAEGQRKDSQD